MILSIYFSLYITGSFLQAKSQESKGSTIVMGSFILIDLSLVLEAFYILKFNSSFMEIGVSLFEPGDTITWNSSYVGATVRENSSINSMLLYRPSNQVLWQSMNNVSSGLSISVFYVNPSSIPSYSMAKL